MAASVEAPLKVENPDQLCWHDAADVVVVGFGGTGAVAAIEARQGGADVLALDSFAGGGATAYSGGVNYAGNTTIQRDAGVDDSIEDMFNYLWAEGVPVKRETLRRFCDESSRNIEWLSGFGIPYAGKLYSEKCTFPPPGYYLFYTGNEKHPQYKAIAKPAPRGHRVATDGFGGHLHFDRLRSAALALGVRLQQHSPVKRLVTDAEGNVIGVEVLAIPQAAWPERQHLYKKVKPWAVANGDRAERAIAANAKLEARFSERRLIRAHAGVLLSTGGFIYNLEMLNRVRPDVGKVYKSLMRIGSMGCDGSGIQMGESVGGVPDLMNRVFVSRNIATPQAQVRGLLVNAAGQRFVNEDMYVGGLGEAIARQERNDCVWLILEARDFWDAFKGALFPGKGIFMLFGLPALLNMVIGGTRRAKSLRDIAQKCGIDYEGLRQTIQNYNAAVLAGTSDPLGKATDYVHSFGDGPYYALNMALDNVFGFTLSFSLGGLRVDEESGAVLKSDGSPIGGLYAAGRTAIGLCSLGYQSGMSIADTVFSGRRAGRSLAAATASRKRIA